MFRPVSLRPTLRLRAPSKTAWASSHESRPAYGRRLPAGQPSPSSTAPFREGLDEQRSHQRRRGVGQDGPNLSQTIFPDQPFQVDWDAGPSGPSPPLKQAVVTHGR